MIGKVKNAKLEDENYFIKGLCINYASLNKEDKLLLDDGQILPAYMLFWFDIINKIQKKCYDNGYVCFWYNESTGIKCGIELSVVCEFMTDSMLWENNNSNLYLVIAGKDQNLRKGIINAKGLLLPMDWGIIAAMDTELHECLADLL